jgi:uncharacterized protein YcbX
MEVVGTVEGLWRYPVKSMRGASLLRALERLNGIYQTIENPVISSTVV